jgi:hypothetical protein
VDAEVEIIGRALVEHGQLSREELARRVGARYWGPGRFRAALREALAEGKATRTGRNLFGPGSGSTSSDGDQTPEPTPTGA